jgi:Ca-activated chloride channel family protein
LWAVRRVGFLLDEIRLHGESPELRDEATDLARKFGIVTPYTAYLIMEDESRHSIPAQSRSFWNFEQDHSTSGQLKQGWDAFREEKSGDGAVASARAGLAMKWADSPNVGTFNSLMESSRALNTPNATVGGGSASPQEAQTTTLAYARQERFAGGKSFFWNDSRWVDSSVQKFSEAKHVRIQFNSQEYFDFIAKCPQALPWLALGQNVQFILGGLVYEIYE